MVGLVTHRARGKLRESMPDEKNKPPLTSPPSASAHGTPGSHSVWVAYRWPLAIVAIAMVVLIAYVIFLKTTKQAYDEALDRAGKGFEKAASTAAEIASKFKSGNITETFTAAIPTAVGTGMGNLELATAEAVETFSRSDAKNIAWDMIHIGTTTTEIKAPVTYRYHLRMADPWKLDVSGQTCIVVAPVIRASQPPAIHTDRMEKKSDRGWARFNASDQMKDLEQSITPTLRQYAEDPRHVGLVREECRKTTAEFVKNWFLREDHWRKDRFHTIKVIFADEIGTDVELTTPTLTIKD